jgi:hypothetical protein
MPDSVTTAPQHPPLDDETAAALTLFNTYLVADREQQAHERALKKAGKAKDEAAAAVRRLNDEKAPAAETAEAEAAYLEAVEALRRLRDGDRAAPQDASDESVDVDAEAVDEQEAPAAEQEAPGPATGTQADTPEAEEPEAADTEPTAETENENEDPGDTEPAAETENENEDPGDEDQPDSVGVEASVGDDDLAGDEPAGVTG